MMDQPDLGKELERLAQVAKADTLEVKEVA